MLVLTPRTQEIHGGAVSRLGSVLPAATQSRKNEVEQAAAAAAAVSWAKHVMGRTTMLQFRKTPEVWDEASCGMEKE